MRRRDLLKQATVAAAAMLLDVPSHAADGQGDAALDITVAITANGREFLYAASAGKDLGDFKGASFTQQCIRVDRTDTPLSVFVRPDRNSNRIEVVFELGRLWGAANAAAHHIGPYRAVIKKAGRELAAIDVAKHWWFARWRWQSAPRPIVRTPADLIAAKLLPPYSVDAAKAADAVESSDPVVYDAPMDTAGLQVELGSTGDRHEIGPVTEYQAEYLITGRPGALVALRAQAEASGSMPMHVRDETTGAPVDFFRYPELDWYYEKRDGNPWIKSAGAIRNAGDKSCPWQLNSAHDPALNYVPYLLTGDPYHLEELQFQGNQLLGWTCTHRAPNKLQIVYPGETRSFAWSMRTMFQLAKVTPDAAPSWLKPRAYWQHIVDDNLKWFTGNYVNESSPACSLFHAGTEVDDIGPWQDDFLVTILGWAVLMGFDDWRKAYEWKLKQTLARTNGRSGWPRQWCTPYFFRIAKSDPKNSLYARKSPAAIWYASWSEAWEAFRADPDNDVSVPFPDTTSWAQSNSPQFLIYTRGALALAAHLGIQEAREPFEFVDNMAKKVDFMAYKWAIAPA